MPREPVFVLVPSAVYYHGVIGVYESKAEAEAAAKEAWLDSDGYHSFTIFERELGRSVDYSDLLHGHWTAEEQTQWRQRYAEPDEPEISFIPLEEEIPTYTKEQARVFLNAEALKAEPLDRKDDFEDLYYTAVEDVTERTLVVTLAADGRPIKFWVQP